MRARKKPVEIEGVLWDGENVREVYDFLTNTKDRPIATCGEFFDVKMCNGTGQTGDLMIKTFEGWIKADIGDYILKGTRGEYYPCKPQVFEDVYEVIEE